MFNSAITNSQVDFSNSNVVNSGNTTTDSYNVNIQNTSGDVTVNTGLQGEDLKSLQQPLREISESLEENKRFEILNWLSKVDYKEHHNFIRSTRQPNTGNWLFKKHDFIQWNKSSSSTIFWLHGIAGAGKTMLASSVIDMSWPTNYAVAYFYCKYGEVDRQEPTSILSTIVKQLSLLSPEGSLPKTLISLYKEQRKDGIEFRPLGLDKSTKLIQQLSKAFEQTVIVVDALDECNKESRYKLLVALKKLCSTEGLKIFLTSRNDDDIRLELENESEVFIQPSDNSGDIKIFVEREVEKYISTKKLLSGNVPLELKQTIIDTLIEGANGMFLWVRFQIEHICKEKLEPAIRKALQRLPKDLKATYSVIWDKVEADTEDNFLLAQRTIKWIICAKSPLTVDEIIEAVSITPMQWAEKPDHASITHTTLLDVCQNLLVLDKELGVLRTAHFSVTEFLLVKINSAEAHTFAAEVCLTLLCCENHFNNHVNSSRQTKNYDQLLDDLSSLCNDDDLNDDNLNDDNLNNDDLNDDDLNDDDLNDDDLNDDDLNNHDLNDDASRDYEIKYSDVLHNYALRNYVMENWAEHIRLSGDGSKTLKELKRMFFEPSPAYSKWLRAASKPDRKLKSNPAGGELNPLWVACYFQLWDIFKFFLDSNSDYTMRNDKGLMPIHLMAQHGYVTGVKLLLYRKGVDSNIEDDQGRTSLHFAAQEGQDTVVRLLLPREGSPYDKTDGGAAEGHVLERYFVIEFFRRLRRNVNAETSDGTTPLHAAAWRGNEAVVRLLLEHKDVDVNAKTNDGETPLYVAALGGNKVVVRLLLAHKDVDVNAKTNDGETPLYAAASTGEDAVVRLLLAHKDVDVNAKPNDGETPLYAAVLWGYEAVVRLLLAHKDVDVNAKTNDGETPLYAVASTGDDAMVRLLLAHKDVDVNAKDNNGETLLYTAALMGNEAVFGLLLERKDVDINAKGGDGWTPLHAAATMGHEAVVRLLLEQKDMDMNTKNDEGWTPLHIAATKDNKAVARVLLEQKDVDVNAKSNNGMTPLHAAALRGNEAVARLLLEQKDGDVNVNAKTSDGETPRDVAAREEYPTVVRLLDE
ncbi:hypothetical protein RUND412_011235, partial [Rhizina undulata]